MDTAAIDTPQAVLNTRPGRVIERYAGDVCSAFAIIGAAGLIASRRYPKVRTPAEVAVWASIGAAAVDTAVQFTNTATERQPELSRGARDSNFGTVAYAATGLVPAASWHAVTALRHVPDKAEAWQLGLLGLNTALMSYEVLHRGPRMKEGREDLSGYGSFLAALTGFVVAKRAWR